MSSPPSSVAADRSGGTRGGTLELASAWRTALVVCSSRARDHDSVTLISARRVRAVVGDTDPIANPRLQLLEFAPENGVEGVDGDVVTVVGTDGQDRVLPVFGRPRLQPDRDPQQFVARLRPPALGERIEQIGDVLRMASSSFRGGVLHDADWYGVSRLLEAALDQGLDFAFGHPH
jgi:hypothetical protein